MITNLEQLINNINPMRNNGGKSPIGEPYAAGTQLGFTIGQLRDFVKLQKRAKGYEIQTVANAVKDQQLIISGNAKILLGFNLALERTVINNITDYSATLTVNNETIFEDVNLSFLYPPFNWKEEEYFPFPRPLSGSDDVKISIRAKANADLVLLELYYI